MNLQAINQIRSFETESFAVSQPAGNLLLALQALQVASDANEAVMAAGEKTAVRGSLATAQASKVTAANSAKVDGIYIEILSLLHKITLGSDLNTMKKLIDELADNFKKNPEAMQDPKIRNLLNDYKAILGKVFQAVFIKEFMEESPEKSWAWLLNAQIVYKDIPGVPGEMMYLQENFGKLVNETTDSQGNRVWHPAGSSATSASYSWKKNSLLIELLIANGQMPGSSDSSAVPNPFADMMKDVMARIKEHYLEKLKAVKDIAGAYLLLMTMFDNDYSNQEGALAYSTDMLTKLTNGIASQLLSFIKTFPPGTIPKDVGDWAAKLPEFAKSLTLVQEIVKSSPQLSGIAENLKNAISDIGSAVGKAKDGSTMTLAQAIDAYMKNPSLENGNNLGSVWQTIASEQGIDNAVQQVGALFTGLSKQVSTNLSIVSGKDNEVIKLGHSVASPEGAFMRFLMSLVHNQKQN